ncbi:MAG: TolC family protein [Phycisphaeraceae bacterium]|nr:TolC family protein [Phycisphaeraceae bacterium]
MQGKRLIITLSLLVPAILPATGCKVDQDKEVALYRAQLDEHRPGATLAAAAPIEAEQTLTLREAMAMANRDNQQLAIRGEDYVQALIDKDRAFAEFLPTISLAPRYTNMEYFKLPPGGSRDMFPQHTLDVPVNAQANVFNGFRDVARLKAAKLSTEEARLMLLDMQATLLLEVAQTYYTVLKAEHAVGVLENSLSVQEARVRDVADRLAQGVARKLDLEQTKAQAADTRVRLADARVAVTKGRATLATLLGVPYVAGKLGDGFSAGPQGLDLEELLKQAGREREDLLAAEQAVLVARKGVDAAFAQYYPSVSVNLDTYTYRESFPQDSLATALITAKVPIFSGGRIHADVRTAWSRFRQAVLARAALAGQVAQQVRVAHADWTASLQRIGDIESQIAAASGAMEIVNQSYDQGLATNLDRMDTQDRLLAAELRLTSERYDATIYYLELMRSIGSMPRVFTELSPATQPAISDSAAGDLP